MHYINTHKKILVNSVNMPLKQKISVDYGTEPQMTFGLLDKVGKPFNIPAEAEFYLAGDVDFNQETPPCFYSTEYEVFGNNVAFLIETYTQEFFSKVKNPDTSMVIQLGMKLDGKTTILLQDEILTQPRIYIEGQPAPSVSENFYTSGEVDEILKNYTTKSELDEAIKNVDVDLTGYATTEYVDEKFDAIPEPDVNLSAYTGGVSITGELENYENKAVLKYEVKNNTPTIKIGNTENVIPVGGVGMNIEQKADNVEVVAGKILTLQAYKQGNIQSASMFLSDSGRFDLNSDVFSYYGNTFQINAPNVLMKNGCGLNYSNGLCLLNDKGNLPFYVSEPYINKSDIYDGNVYFYFGNDAKIDWYTCYSTGLIFNVDNNFQFAYPDGYTKRMEDNCITKEIWISPVATVEVISIPEYVQVIGEMPTSLEPTKEIMYNGSSYNRQLTHVFVVRGINYNDRWIYTINYAYNFISDYDGFF